MRSWRAVPDDAMSSRYSCGMTAYCIYGHSVTFVGCETAPLDLSLYGPCAASDVVKPLNDRQLTIWTIQVLFQIFSDLIVTVLKDLGSASMKFFFCPRQKVLDRKDIIRAAVSDPERSSPEQRMFLPTFTRTSCPQDEATDLEIDRPYSCTTILEATTFMRFSLKRTGTSLCISSRVLLVLSKCDLCQPGVLDIMDSGQSIRYPSNGSKRAVLRMPSEYCKGTSTNEFF